MQLNGTALAMVALLLTACAPSAVTANTDLSGTKEPRGMEQPTNPEQPDAPTATQLLEGLLRLIESSGSVKDFTPERVEKDLGVPLKASGEDRWGAGAQVSPDWWVGLSVHRVSVADRVEFLLQFEPDQGNATPSMTSICVPDAQAFGDRLVESGMAHETNYVEHGFPLSEKYTRPGLEVEVFSRPEPGESKVTPRHYCVQMVIVR